MSNIKFIKGEKALYIFSQPGNESMECIVLRDEGGKNVEISYEFFGVKTDSVDRRSVWKKHGGLEVRG